LDGERVLLLTASGLSVAFKEIFSSRIPELRYLEVVVRGCCPINVGPDSRTLCADILVSLERRADGAVKSRSCFGRNLMCLCWRVDVARSHRGGFAVVDRREGIRDQRRSRGGGLRDVMGLMY